MDSKAFSYRLFNGISKNKKWILLALIKHKTQYPMMIKLNKKQVLKGVKKQLKLYIN